MGVYLATEQKSPFTVGTNSSFPLRLINRIIKDLETDQSDWKKPLVGRKKPQSSGSHFQTNCVSFYPRSPKFPPPGTRQIQRVSYGWIKVAGG